MKRYVLIILLLCVCFASRAQNNNFYYANGVAQYWEDDSTSANIIVRNQNNYDTIVCGLNTIFNDIDDEILSDNEELREWLVKSEDIFADRMVVASFRKAIMTMRSLMLR